MTEPNEQKHPEGAPGEWKKPNFGGIVIGSVVFIVVMMGAALLLVKSEGGHLMLRTRTTHANQN